MVPMTTAVSAQTAILLIKLLANSPMMNGSEVKQRVGRMAKGNITAIKMFKTLFR